MILFFFTLKILESNIMTQEKAGELTHDLQVPEADTAVSPNFTLKKERKTGHIFKAQDLESSIIIERKVVSVHWYT